MDSSLSVIRKRSVGGGFRGTLGDRLAIDAAIGIPLKEVGLSDERRRPDPRFLLTLTSRLLPWS